MPLIAIAGSQGCGKTTILNELEAQGHNVIKRKTARSVLTDWNMTLAEVYSDRPRFLLFQELLADRKFEDEVAATGPKELWFTERTFADLLVYATVILGPFNEFNEDLSNYRHHLAALQRIYEKVFFLDVLPGNTVEHDEVRSINPMYSMLVDVSMRKFTNDLTPPEKVIHIESTVLSDRIDIILQNV